MFSYPTWYNHCKREYRKDTIFFSRIISQPGRPVDASWRHIYNIGHFGSCFVLWRSIISLTRWCYAQQRGIILCIDPPYPHPTCLPEIDLRVIHRCVLPCWPNLTLSTAHRAMMLSFCFYSWHLERRPVCVLEFRLYLLQDLEWTMYPRGQLFLVYRFVNCVAKDLSNLGNCTLPHEWYCWGLVTKHHM